MEIVITGEANEIAALVEALQGRRNIHWDPSEREINDFVNILLARHDTKPEAPEISSN